MLAALNLEEPDKIPIAPMGVGGGWYLPKLFGLEISSYTLADNGTKAKMYLAAQKKYGYDWIETERAHWGADWRKKVKIKRVKGGYLVTDLVTFDSEDGSQKFIPRNELPDSKMGSRKLESLEEIELLDHKTILKSGVLEPIEIVCKKVGNKVLVAGHLSSPFFRLSMWTGLNELLVGLYRKPRLVEKGLELALKYEIEFGRALSEVGIGCFFAEECFASSDVLSPSLYERFAFPSERSFVKQLKTLDVPLVFSFLGDAMPRLERVTKVGADAYHFEESKKNFTVDAVKLKEAVSGKACLFAPLDSLKLRTADVGTVDKMVKEMINQVGVGGGAVLSFGSVLMKDTPLENFETVIKTARSAGTYPITHQLDA